MRWVKKLRRLISGADSNTGERAGQSEYSRKTVRSVEITVETDEIILWQTTNTGFSDATPAERRQDTNDRTEDTVATFGCGREEED